MIFRDVNLVLVSPHDLEMCGASQTHGISHCGKWKKRDFKQAKDNLAPCSSGCTWAIAGSRLGDDGWHMVFVDKAANTVERHQFPGINDYVAFARTAQGLTSKEIASEFRDKLLPMVRAYERRHAVANVAETVFAELDEAVRQYISENALAASRMQV